VFWGEFLREIKLKSCRSVWVWIDSPTYNTVGMGSLMCVLNCAVAQSCRYFLHLGGLSCLGGPKLATVEHESERAGYRSNCLRADGGVDYEAGGGGVGCQETLERLRGFEWGAAQSYVAVCVEHSS
jgi:hypothetical protein